MDVVVTAESADSSSQTIAKSTGDEPRQSMVESDLVEGNRFQKAVTAWRSNNVGESSDDRVNNVFVQTLI